MPRRAASAAAGPFGSNSVAGSKRTKTTVEEEQEVGDTIKVQMHKVDLCWKVKFEEYFPNPAADGLEFDLQWYMEYNSDQDTIAVKGLTDGTSWSGGADKHITCKLRPKLDKTLGPGSWNGLYPELVISFNLKNTFFSEGGKYSRGNIKLNVHIVDKCGKVAVAGDDKIYSSREYDKWKSRRRLPPFQQLWDEKDKYFPDGVLLIKYQLLFLRNMPGLQKLDLLPKSMATLTQDLGKLFQDGVDTDFIIKCGDTEFPVHKLILRARSPVFANMLAANMKERAEGMVEVEDVEPGTMKAVLEYIYSSTIKPDLYEDGQLLAIVLAADKYGLIELKDTFLHYMICKMQSMEPSVLGQLAGLVHLVSDAGIKDQVLKYCADNFSFLSKYEGFVAAVSKIPTNLFQQLEFVTKCKE